MSLNYSEYNTTNTTIPESNLEFDYAGVVQLVLFGLLCILVISSTVHTECKKCRNRPEAQPLLTEV